MTHAPQVGLRTSPSSAPLALLGFTGVVLATHHKLAGQSLAHMLEPEIDLRVAGLAQDAPETLRLLALHQQSVVIVEHKPPQLDAVRMAELILKAFPGLGLIVLAPSDQMHDLFAALHLGARGFLPLDATADQILATVRAVARGEACLPPAITTRLLSEFRRLTPPLRAPAAETGSLTDRETSILSLVAAGKNNRDIARRLSLTEGTVKNHVSRILTKLQARNRTELAVRCRNFALI